MSLDFRRMFEDAKRQGAQKSHWDGLDALMKGHLATRAQERMKIDRMLNGSYEPFLPGVDVPAQLKTATARLSVEIEEINNVRRDIAAELANLEAQATSREGALE